MFGISCRYGVYDGFSGNAFLGEWQGSIQSLRNQQEVSIDADDGPVGHAYRANANWLWQSASTKLEGSQIELIEKF